jgi:transposase-like protein
MDSQPRRHFSPQEKVAILRRHFLEKVSIAALCDEYGISPGNFYNWQKIAFENLTSAFEQNGRRTRSPESGKDQKIAALEAKVQRKNEVLAELMEEHTALKKSLGEP